MSTQLRRPVRSSRRTRAIGAARGLGAIVATVGLTIAGTGCATEVPSQRDLADALFDSGLTRDLADCAAEAVVGTLSEDELRLLVERGSGAPPEGSSAEEVRTALDACRAEADQAAADAAADAPAGG